MRFTKEKKTNYDYYWDLAFSTIKELETDNGILASSQKEIYGALFGRDSLITSLKLLRVYQETKIDDFLEIVRKVLTSLSTLQGQEFNINSGEEPGKIIHEFRPHGHEHLTQRLDKPWYLYPDQMMRNYDSVDSTSLFLITYYRYLQVSNQLKTVPKGILGHIQSALDWLLLYGDSNKDGLIDYSLQQDRIFGGLQNQNWMDSTESTFHEDGKPVTYPLAPVEAQAYSYLALRLWGSYYKNNNPAKSLELNNKAYELKTIFNQRYIQKDSQGIFLASAIDNGGEPLLAVRSSMGHVLWAAQTRNLDGITDTILEKKYIPKIADRLMKPDLFVSEAGIRTLSKNSSQYQPNSYHNGSIWPHDTGIIAEGFENFGFYKEAKKVRSSILKAIDHFQTPLELFVFDKTYADYSSTNGQTSCKQQAWSAAALLSTVTPHYNGDHLKIIFPYFNTLEYSLLNGLDQTFLLSKLVASNVFSIFPTKVKPIKSLNKVLVTTQQIAGKFKPK